MKIYKKNNKGKFRETTLKEVLIAAILGATKGKYDIISNKFEDDSSSWIEIYKSGDDGLKKMNITIAFEGDENTLQDIVAWESEYELIEKDSVRKF